MVSYLIRSVFKRRAAAECKYLTTRLDLNVLVQCKYITSRPNLCGIFSIQNKKMKKTRNKTLFGEKANRSTNISE